MLDRLEGIIVDGFDCIVDSEPPMIAVLPTILAHESIPRRACQSIPKRDL